MQPRTNAPNRETTRHHPRNGDGGGGDDGGGGGRYNMGAMLLNAGRAAEAKGCFEQVRSSIVICVQLSRRGGDPRARRI